MESRLSLRVRDMISRRGESRLIAFGRIGPSSLARFVRYSTPRTRCIIGTYLATSPRRAFTFPISAFLPYVRNVGGRGTAVYRGTNGEKPITCEKISKKWNRFYRSVARFLGGMTLDTESSVFPFVLYCLRWMWLSDHCEIVSLRLKLIRVYPEI